MSIITARYESQCPVCGRKIRPGAPVEWSKGKAAVHVDCASGASGAGRLIVEVAKDGDSWIECKDCGAAEWMSKIQKTHDKTLRHKSGCKSRQQPTDANASGKSAAQLEREIAEIARDEDLKKLASQVRRNGMSGGRDSDVREAVRLGYLSESDAMNMDD